MNNTTSDWAQNEAVLSFNVAELFLELLFALVFSELTYFILRRNRFLHGGVFIILVRQRQHQRQFHLVRVVRPGNGRFQGPDNVRIQGAERF
ncbi:hypothetical protein ASPZODRAFT_130540 [Penicilliopsis zonata CBS 506.65]|uniref:Uncharacterized protein n=1 Tax=Penicilliopsis zonata CBS 506.65 TaxID=1073090 RepID=A0A1L9SMJ1_9EURO|nr:hypothetical protein ASPZODRAFT_130540 [Penicilliopsis zonata CBS 506.65]OJJ48492.1 hypothetical protein ASPZODRAFT_130540 [Penicilliopsis zonata CBS 506.65]